MRHLIFCYKEGHAQRKSDGKPIKYSRCGNSGGNQGLRTGCTIRVGNFQLSLNLLVVILIKETIAGRGRSMMSAAKISKEYWK
jgi:6-phosphogluconate dehydrogenase (decarboxylating)